MMPRNRWEISRGTKSRPKAGTALLSRYFNAAADSARCPTLSPLARTHRGRRAREPQNV